jgi:hypothetical protein
MLDLTDDVDANELDVKPKDDRPTSNVPSALNVSPESKPDEPELNSTLEENASPLASSRLPDCAFKVQLFVSVVTVTPGAIVSDPPDATYSDAP